MRVSAIRWPNTYQGSVVKRADGCIAGAEGPSEEHLVNHHCQAIAADLISVAGPSRRLHQTPIEGQCFSGVMFHGKQWSPRTTP